MTWINIGDANVYLKAIPEFFATFQNINSPNISESNDANHPGDWDDIFVEGTATMPATEISLLGAKPHESAIPSNPAHGVISSTRAIPRFATRNGGAALTTRPSIRNLTWAAWNWSRRA